MLIDELFLFDAQMEFTEEETYWTFIYSAEGRMVSCWVYWNAEA